MLAKLDDSLIIIIVIVTKTKKERALEDVYSRRYYNFENPTVSVVIVILSSCIDAAVMDQKPF